MISFNRFMPCWRFNIAEDVAQGTTIQPTHWIGFPLLTTVPITLKRHDVITVDLRDGFIHKIERNGAMIWHSGWVN